MLSIADTAVLHLAGDDDVQYSCWTRECLPCVPLPTICPFVWMSAVRDCVSACLCVCRWWNPAVEMQAIQRAHRIGQTRAVEAIRFCTTDSIEDNSKRAVDARYCSCCRIDALLSHPHLSLTKTASSCCPCLLLGLHLPVRRQQRHQLPVMALQAKKQLVFEGVADGKFSAMASKLSQKDLQFLFRN
eukprot:COSAG02_NODE_612_length_19541_cov_13.245150_12_plen_187_part_00